MLVMGDVKLIDGLKIELGNLGQRQLTSFCIPLDAWQFLRAKHSGKPQLSYNYLCKRG